MTRGMGTWPCLFLNIFLMIRTFLIFCLLFWTKKVFLKQIYSKRTELATKIGLHSFKPSPQKKKKRGGHGWGGGGGGGVKILTLLFSVTRCSIEIRKRAILLAVPLFQCSGFGRLIFRHISHFCDYGIDTYINICYKPYSNCNYCMF